MEKLRRLKKRYDKPTPVKWRRLGDAILTVGSGISAISAYTDNKLITIAGIGITVLGKFITNLATERDG